MLDAATLISQKDKKRSIRAGCSSQRVGLVRLSKSSLKDPGRSKLIRAGKDHQEETREALAASDAAAIASGTATLEAALLRHRW